MPNIPYHFLCIIAVKPRKKWFCWDLQYYIRLRYKLQTLLATALHLCTIFLLEIIFLLMWKQELHFNHNSNFNNGTTLSLLSINITISSTPPTILLFLKHVKIISLSSHSKANLLFLWWPNPSPHCELHHQPPCSYCQSFSNNMKSANTNIMNLYISLPPSTTCTSTSLLSVRTKPLKQMVSEAKIYQPL